MMAFEREMDAAKLLLLSAVAACVSIPGRPIPLAFMPTQRCLLVHGGILRLLLPLRLPRTLAWQGTGLFSGAGDAPGLRAHACPEAAVWARLWFGYLAPKI